MQLSSFVIQLFLARVLLPEAFGMIAMLQIFVSIGQTLMDGGMTSSLIRTPNPDQKDYSTVFFLNVTLSIIVYGLIFGSSGFIADFFRKPLLQDILKVYSLSIIVQSLIAVQLAKFTKELDFRSQLILEIPSLILSSIIGIYLALNNYGVWSLVWLHVSKSLFFAAQVWLFVGWRPKPVFDIQTLREHVNFGYKLTLSSLLNTIYDNLYNIIIGRMYSATQLGFYDRANSLRQLPVLTISSALNKVTYPMFAAIQDDEQKMKRTYKVVMEAVLFFMAPMLVLLAVIAEPLFVILLTEKWLPAVPYFQILCFASILYPIHAYNLNVITVKGRSELFLKLEILKKVVITIGILISLPFGIYGLVYLQLINSLIGFFINSYYSGKLINYPTNEQIRTIAPIISLALGIGCIAYLISSSHVIPNYDSYVIQIFIISTIYIVLYIGLSFLLKISVVRDIKNQIFIK